MKNKIRQILREETSEFDENMFNVLRQFMKFLTKDYKWYYDTPEKRFVWTPGSIWLINPKTKEWVLFLKKDGTLWWYRDIYINFQRYFSMEQSDFERFIKVWVEDVFNRGVSKTRREWESQWIRVDDVLKNGKQMK